MSSSDRPPTSVTVEALDEDFESFFRREYPAMVALAAAVAGRRDFAEDLAQEAFTKAHNEWDRIGRFDKPGAWVRRVVINLSISSKRRGASEAKARLRLAGMRREAHPSTDPSASVAGSDHGVWAAVADLPGNQRAAVALFYLEERTVSEIADILECSTSTAKVHLHRGRSKLAEVLAPAGSDPSTSPSTGTPKSGSDS